MGLVGFDSARIRDGDEEPKFGQFLWDVSAPSYVYPLMSRERGKDPVPGFFVADVVLGQTVTKAQGRYFQQKCGMMRHQRKTRPFLAMMVADGFEKEAFEAIRRDGCMPVSLQNLTGEAVAAGLKALIDTLANAAAVVAQRPEAIGDLFSKLSAIEGAAANLRGPLFELIVAHCVREREGNSVDIGKSIWDPTNGQPTDIDVLRVKEKQEVCSYECRGHGPNVTVQLEEVQRWLNVTVPRTRNYLLAQERFEQSSMAFEFWTTGSFSKAALRYLESVGGKRTKYAIRWKDGQEVLKYVRTVKATHLVNVLQEQYLRHPMTPARINTAQPSPESPHGGNGKREDVEAVGDGQAAANANGADAVTSAPVPASGR